MAMDSIGWNEPVQTGEDENGTPVGVSGWDATQGEREFERQGRDAYGDDWMSALNAQEHQRKWAEDRAIAQQSERVFNDLNNIALRDKQQKLQLRQMNDATLSALMRQAQTNDGFVPASVLDAASQNLGIPILAGDTWDSNVILGAVKGTNVDINVTTFFAKGRQLLPMGARQSDGADDRLGRRNARNAVRRVRALPHRPCAAAEDI